jgi:type IV secretion system protein VirB2
VVLLAGVLSLAAPEPAYAEVWDSTIQEIIDAFTGGLARVLAILGIIACGVLAFAGRLQWTWALSIVGGIILIFGAANIADLLIGAAEGGG